MLFFGMVKIKPIVPTSGIHPIFCFHFLYFCSNVKGTLVLNH